jgi:hypothetical protein
MYESHYACHFFRLWGGKDSSHNSKATLLGNMQNPFDEFFGDVNGDANNRYFIIEFKLKRRGIWDEIAEKPHRKALTAELFLGKELRMLSHVGHFAAYPKDENLRFEPYLNATIPLKTYVKNEEKISNIIDELNKNNTLPQGFQVFGRTISFDVFHSFITENNNSISSVFPGFYEFGLGWTKEQLSQYVNKAMYAHLVVGKVENKKKKDGANDDAVLMLGTYKQDGTFIGLVGNIEEIILKLHLAFEQIKLIGKPNP